MIELYSTLPKKNNHFASCERVAGRPTARHVYVARWAFAGGMVPGVAGWKRARFPVDEGIPRTPKADDRPSEGMPSGLCITRR
jgi:hypothetical protein